MRFLISMSLVTCAVSGSWPSDMVTYVGDDAVYELTSNGMALDHENIKSPYGEEGRVLADGAVRFYVKDHLGSTRLVMNDASGVDEANFYFSYGNADKLFVSSRPTREKFTGKEFDEDGIGAGIVGIKLSYFGARYYDPDIGLWISPDPARQFATPYAYGSSPVNGIDRDGRVFGADGKNGTHVNSDAFFNELSGREADDPVGGFVNCVSWASLFMGNPTALYTSGWMQLMMDGYGTGVEVANHKNVDVTTTQAKMNIGTTWGADLAAIILDFDGARGAIWDLFINYAIDFTENNLPPPHSGDVEVGPLEVHTAKPNSDN